MLILANAELRVELLDPAVDQARLGPRYCWGGYIWQVHDARAGPLLTGPEWPKPDPTAFNGQGLPESFRHSTRDGRPLTWNGDRGIAVGAGELARNSAGEVELLRPCQWQITPDREQISFHTRHDAAGFAYELTRHVELAGRTLNSVSTLTNHAAMPLCLEWFAHPFFALTDRLIGAELPAGTTVADNPAFAITGRRLDQKRRFASVTDGHFDFLRLPPAPTLTAKLNHPVLTHVGFATSFAPGECIIWGNANTFSIEPYLALALAPGRTKEWSVRYEFGEIA